MTTIRDIMPLFPLPALPNAPKELADLATTVEKTFASIADCPVDVYEGPALLPRHQGVEHYEPIENAETYGAFGPKVADIRQGQVGDCWFLATLAAVCHERPLDIQRMIRRSPDGGYDVRFYDEVFPGLVREEWVHVNAELTDVYAAAADNDGDHRPEIWVPIVEKAMALFMTRHQPEGGGEGYQAIDADYTYRAITALTGHAADYEVITANDTDTAWRMLQRANSGTAVVAETPAAPADARIVGGHAYTVLGTHEENGVKYVTLRNPWGSTEPGTDGDDDGVFTITLGQFARNYVGITAAKPDPMLDMQDLLRRV